MAQLIGLSGLGGGMKDARRHVARETRKEICMRVV